MSNDDDAYLEVMRRSPLQADRVHAEMYKLGMEGQWPSEWYDFNVDPSIPLDARVSMLAQRVGAEAYAQFPGDAAAAEHLAQAVRRNIDFWRKGREKARQNTKRADIEL